MVRFFPQLLLACLLVLSQATLASHDVQHLGSEHNELCTVYLSQDHSEHGIAADNAPTTTFYAERFQADAADVFLAVTSSVYASRAPPHTVFFS